jgi:hypothetical protein
MSNTIDLDDLLSNKEAARLLGIRPNTLEIWRVQGKGPAFLKLGDQPQSTVRYLRSTVIAWASQRAFRNTSAYKVNYPTECGAKSDVIHANSPTRLPASSKLRDAS